MADDAAGWQDAVARASRSGGMFDASCCCCCNDRACLDDGGDGAARGKIHPRRAICRSAARRAGAVTPTATPVIKDVVLLGAGHSHVGVLRMFGMDPLPGVRFTLITREVHTPYSGMLPGLIAGTYAFDDAHIDTGPLARFARARLYRDEAIGLDLANRRVVCRDRPPVPYDLVSIDIGSTPNVYDVPGAADHAIPVKPIGGFLARCAAGGARGRDARASASSARAPAASSCCSRSNGASGATSRRVAAIPSASP